MAMRWEIHDGKEQVGPLEEEHVLRMIAEGLPATALVRPEGKETWKGLRSHAPFAMALEARGEAAASSAPAPAPPPAVPTPVQVQNVVTTRPETSMVTWGCAGIAVLLLLAAVGGAIVKGCESERVVGPDGRNVPARTSPR